MAPIVILVVLVATPPVPMFTVFVAPLAEEPAPMLNVAVPVVPNIVTLVAAANSVTVVASANNASVPDVAVMLVAFVNEIVVFLIVAVPLVWPIVNAEAAPKIVAVVAAPNTAREEGLAEENTVAKPDEPLIVVALGKSIVAFLIVPVPDAAPNVNDVAAPKIVAVVAAPNTAKDEGLADEKTVAKPDDPLIVVALGKSIVAFLIVPVPEVAPIVNDVAEPKIVAVVAAPNTAKDEGLALENTVANAALPLIVVALVKSTVAFLNCIVPAEEPIPSVVAAPNAVNVVAFVPNNVRFVVFVTIEGLSIVNEPEAVVPKV